MTELETKKIAILEREARVKEQELELKVKESEGSSWRSPLVVAVLAATLAAFSNAGIAWLNGYLARHAAEADFEREIELAEAAAENDRILEMIKIGEPVQVERNLQFLIETDLVTRPELVASISEYYRDREPGTGPGTSTTPVPVDRRKAFRAGETVTYSFLASPSEKQRSVVEEAFARWIAHGNLEVSFEEDPEKAVIRIAFDPQRGNMSYVGRDALRAPSAVPTMNLASDITKEENFDLLLHEVGHALGLPNEISNPREGILWDRDAVFSYYTRFGMNAAQIERQILYKASSYPCSRSFDANSIMMHRIPSGLTIDGNEIIPEPGLSESDKECFAEMYPEGIVVLEEGISPEEEVE